MFTQLTCLMKCATTWMVLRICMFGSLLCVISRPKMVAEKLNNYVLKQKVKSEKAGLCTLFLRVHCCYLDWHVVLYRGTISAAWFDLYIIWFFHCADAIKKTRVLNQGAAITSIKNSMCLYVLPIDISCLITYNENHMFHSRLHTEDLGCSCLSEKKKSTRNLSPLLKIKVCVSSKG